MKKPLSLVVLFLLLGVFVLVVLINFDVFKKDSSRPTQSIQSLKEKKTVKEITPKEIVVEPLAKNEYSIKSDDFQIARINSGSTGSQQITKKEEDVPTRVVKEISFKSDDFEIAGIGIGSIGKDVLKVFGEPKNKKRNIEKTEYDNDICYDTWTYPDLEIYFFTILEKGKRVPIIPDRVLSIDVLTSKYETKRGIKIGDSVKKVFEKYGEPNCDNCVKKDNHYQYKNDGMTHIDFAETDGKVSKIDIWSELD